MIFKKLHLGGIVFGKDTLDELDGYLRDSYKPAEVTANGGGVFSTLSTDSLAMPNICLATFGAFSLPLFFVTAESRLKKNLPAKVRTAISVLALCHNVTPNVEPDGTVSYQASSPDEVALVKFTESVGLTLYSRSLTTMTLKNPLNEYEEYEVLNVFPFTSETKRMGIIVRDNSTKTITFYMKGADVVMSKIVMSTDWLDEECGNMAREGLRTLVFGFREMSEDEYHDFAKRLADAKTTINNRDRNVQDTIESIEKDLQLVGVTGVEDLLQEDVKPTLEMLRNAGIKVWMLTGDKIETATCIAISARLVSRTQSIYQFTGSLHQFVIF
jgi:phospholipid-translocating ATPase